MGKWAPQMPLTVKARISHAVGALAILLAMLGYFEGNKLSAYLDGSGIPTICQGITKGVHMGQVATVEQCKSMNTAEAMSSIRVIRRTLQGNHPEARIAALADLQYNTGTGNWMASTARRKLNAGDIRGGCDAVKLFVCVSTKSGTGATTGQCATKAANKVVSAWQVHRRYVERNVCWCGTVECGDAG